MKTRKTDHTGHTYGKLTILRELSKSERSSDKREFLCHCECGNKRIATLNSLTQGTVKSCGCSRSDRYKKIDLTGKVFGRLTVVKSAGVKDKQRMWSCSCECGKSKVASTATLNAGYTKSCGCMKKETVRSNFHSEKQRIDGTLAHALRKRTTNKTGVKGVYERVHGDHVYYQARIGINKKVIVLGNFKTIEEAAKVRRKAEIKYHEPILEKEKQKGV